MDIGGRTVALRVARPLVLLATLAALLLAVLPGAAPVSGAVAVHQQSSAAGFGTFADGTAHGLPGHGAIRPTDPRLAPDAPVPGRAAAAPVALSHPAESIGRPGRSSSTASGSAALTAVRDRAPPPVAGI